MTKAPPGGRRRGLQTAAGIYLLVIGVLALAGTVAGAVYAVQTDQVRPEEGGTAAAIFVPLSLLLLVVPAVLVLWLRTEWVTIGAGLVVPGVIVLATGVLPIYSFPALLLGAPAAVLTACWLWSGTGAGSGAGALAPPRATIRSAPPGTYQVLSLGHTHGPYTADQLVDLARDGQVHPDSTLRYNDGDPFSAREIGSLFV